MAEPILLNDFPRAWRELGGDVHATVERVGLSGWYVLGAEVAAFEEALARKWGLGQAVGVGNGLDALEIGLRCLGIGAGDRVLTTPLSAFASTLAILRVGAVPVFVDVDAHGLLDLEATADRLRRGSAVRALLPVHLFGHAVDCGVLAELAAASGAVVLEDCAQSIGATHRGVATGTVGAIAATSFYPTKNLGALGDGGAVLARDPELAARARRIRSYGEAGKYEHVEVGMNSRLDEIHAAILHSVMLPHLEEWTERRRHVARRYCEGIAHPDVVVPGAPTGSESVWHLFPVLVDPGRRASFRAHLKGAGVETGLHYPVAIPDQRALAAAALESHGDLPRARAWSRGEVSLPIHPWLYVVEVERVVAACNSWRP
jgi:dTDP-3-amino-3,4,6-trideoxy-alpha-D-glucose transaminase